MIPAIRNQEEPEDFDMDATEAEYFRSIGRLEAQVTALTAAVGELKTKLDGIDTRLDTLDRMANRWKGGFAVILTLGAVAGFVIDHLFRLILPR
jgi:hypothetical protein